MTDRRSALIVASYEYDDADFTRLQAPEHDAEDLAAVLGNAAIGGFEVATLVNKPSYVIREEIEAFFGDRMRDDLLLLYFSGHGIKDETGQLYLAARNTKRKRLRSTAVAASYVNEVMRHCRSRQQILILDTCYSGAFARGMTVRAGTEVGTGEVFGGGRGHFVLTASDAMQYAFEGDDLKGEGVRSVFTRSLIDGLESGAADLDQDGLISCDELYSYVCDQVAEQTSQQEPRKWAFDVQGEVVVARNPRPAEKTLPEQLLHALESPFVNTREGAARDLAALLTGADRGMARAAESGLKLLLDDDSRRVSAVAAKMLQAETAHGETPPAPPSPEVKPARPRAEPKKSVQTTQAARRKVETPAPSAAQQAGQAEPGDAATEAAAVRPSAVTSRWATIREPLIRIALLWVSVQIGTAVLISLIYRGIYM